MLSPQDVAAALAAAVALEASAPGKLGTVSSWERSGGLNLADFILSVPYLTKAILSAMNMPPCERVTEVLRAAGEVRKSRIVGKNTVSGYVVLLAPLAPVIERIASGGVNAIDAEWDTIEGCMRRIPAGKLLIAVSEGGVRHLHGFVAGTAPQSLWEEYAISALYDINCWEAINRYALTRRESSGIPCETPPDKAVHTLFMRLAQEVVDTSVLKGKGSGWWLASREAIIKKNDEFLRKHGVNLGSVADLTALATAFWVIRCAGGNR